PEDDASLRYTRESERLSFYDYIRLHMSSVTRWSRFYRTTGPQRGQVVLLAMRMYPKKKNDTRWIYVKPDRALGVGDIKDRAKMSSRRQPGWDYEAFPALTAPEKADILEKAKEEQLEAELYLSNIRGYVASLSWFRSGLVGVWSTWNWGSTAGAAFFFWRVAVYCNLRQWMRWSVEKLEDGHNMILEIDDFRGYLHDLYQDGKLEIPIMIFTAVVALGPRLLRCCRQRPSPLLAGASPPVSDVDSDGKAGHSVAGSSDESEPAKDMQETKAMMSNLLDEITKSKSESPRAPTSRSASSAASPGESSHASWEKIPSVNTDSSMDVHVDRMIDRLKRFEDTINADKETLEGAGVSLEPLREALRDPRERLLANLSKIDAPPTFTLPAGLTSRVAPELLVQTYGKYGSMVKFATDWVRLKELNRNHIGHEMMLHCMTLERMLEASPEFIQTAGCEILCARAYALKRAFKDVACINDWKQPRGSGANKWKSNARWDLANELGWRSLTEGGEALPGVERDLTARLQQKALFQKYMQKGGSDAVKEEDE
ncbi:unnamed protein product, partial [Prorocentrum cordatum]